MTRITSAVTFGEAIRARRKEMHYTHNVINLVKVAEPRIPSVYRIRQCQN